MSRPVPKVYCGPVGLKLRNIVGLKTTTDIPSYFKNCNVVYVHKGRTAIRIACDLLRLGKDSEILAPAYNCGSEIDALISSGAWVNLYRITRNAEIDIKDLESRITNRTKAIYVTHYFGFPQPIELIKNICKNNNLYLIEDCALTLFSWHGNKMIGTTGDLAIFSLPKTLPVPDGGILLANNEVLQRQSISLSQPGWPNIFIDALPSCKAALIRWLSLNPPFNRLYNINTNIRQTGCKNNDRPNIKRRHDMPQNYYYDDQYSNKILSSCTRHLIKTFDPNEIKAKRRRNFKALGSMLAPCPWVTPLYKELPDDVCPLNYPLCIEEKRDAIVQKLNRQQIDARAWWRGFHKMLPWSEFPDACYLKDNLMALPVHQDLPETAIEYMAKCIKDFL